MRYVFRRRRLRWAAAAADALGWLLLGWGRRARRALHGLDGKTLLVIRLDHIGDVLLASGVPKAVKEHYPGCRVVFLVSSWAKPLLEYNPFIDRLLVWDAPWFARSSRPSSGALSSWGLLRALRDEKIDAGLSLRGDVRENAWMFLAGVRQRVGYGITGGGFLLTDSPRYPERAHEAERAARLLATWGIRSPVKPSLYLTPREEEWAAAWLASRGAADGRPLVGLQLYAGTPAKEWSALRRVHFLELAARELSGSRLVIVGSAADRARLERELAEAGRPDLLRGSSILVAAGELTLRQTAVLIRKMRLFFGPDSGPAHLASALGVRTHFLYSGTNDFESWKPLSDEAVVWRTSVSCAPCGLKVCTVPGHPCVDATEPSVITAALRGEIER